MTGVEGYVESAASGLVAGINAAKRLMGESKMIFPQLTAIGALSAYISDSSIENFQPMNVNFGLLPPIEGRYKNKKDKYARVAERALNAIDEIALK